MGQRLPQVLDGIIDTTLLRQRQRQIVPGIGKVGFELRGRFEVKDRVVVPFEELQGKAKSVVCLGMLMIEL